MTCFLIATNSMALDGKLPQGDHRWGAFNDSFVNQTLDITDIANAIYTGHAYTTQHDGRRKSENFIAGQHIAVEFDTMDERSTLKYIMSNKFAAAYGGLWHTTPSHKKDAPRSRLIFLLDQPITDRIKYEAAVGALMAFFPWADQSTKDAVRFFYGAKECAIEFTSEVNLGNVLPLAHLRKAYSQWRIRHTQQAKREPGRIIRLDDERAKRAAETTYGDDLPPLADYVASLKRIDPYSIDYNRWVGIIKAARDDYGDIALAYVEAWAQGKPGEVDKIWATANTGTGRMSVRTVFYMARNG